MMINGTPMTTAAAFRMRHVMLMCVSGLTTQAQRPGARDATIATATPPPGSLQRMVRHPTHDFLSLFNRISPIKKQITPAGRVRTTTKLLESGPSSLGTTTLASMRISPMISNVMPFILLSVR